MTQEEVHSDIKFILPPIVAFLFILLVDPGGFWETVQLQNQSQNLSLIVIFGSIPVILAFGFLISSVSYVLLSILRLRYPVFGNKEQSKLKKIFHAPKENFNKTVEAEVADWIVQIKYYSEIIQKKTDKRWKMAITNLNCLVALIFVILIVLVFCCWKIINPSCYWFILWGFFLIIFGYNFLCAYKDVNKMSNFLARNLNDRELTSQNFMEKFYQGNLENDLKNFCGPEKYKEWLVGKFDKFDGDIRKTDLLELKYWEIEKGKEREHATKVQKSVGEITIILEGKARGFIGEKDVTLEKDRYFYIPPGVINNLVVEVMEGEKIKGLTIKAPSDPSDYIKIPRC